MRNAMALAKRILQQFRHDPRTVAMLVVAPVFVMWLLSIILGSPGFKPTVAAVGLPDQMVQALENNATVVQVDANSTTDPADILTDRSIDAVVALDGTTLQVTVEGSNATHNRASIAAVQQAMASMTQAAQPGGQQGPPQATIDISYLHGSSDWGSFDFFGPIFIGVFVFMFVFITSGMSLVTERTGGTMERLLVSPIKAWQLVAGYCIGFGVAAAIQSVLVLAASILLLKFPNEGQTWLVVVITFSMALVSMALGLLVSALAKTAFQVIQLMILLLVPQILVSGIFDLSTAPRWMQILSQCFPITHGANALLGVMLRGDRFSGIGLDLGIVWAFFVVLFGLATMSFARRQTR
ncbi:MAG: ABC transporter permease [Propionibacteriaceae bacterium]|nr:ABC transporter permease [Propionibacteriaceae bacterium]